MLRKVLVKAQFLMAEIAVGKPKSSWGCARPQDHGISMVFSQDVVMRSHQTDLLGASS